MTIAAVLLIASGLVVARRRAKRRLVAGLVSERPAFTVSPPTRWVSDRKDYRL